MILPSSLISSTNKINPNYFRNDKNKEILQEIKIETFFLPETSSISERIYCITNNIKTQPLCSCGSGKNLKFLNNNLGYSSYCSKSCSNKGLAHSNYMKTEFNHSEKLYEKTKQTNLERYGVACTFERKDFIENNINRSLNRTIEEKQQIAEKIKQTTLSHYNVTNVFQSKEIKEKIKQTNLERYGFENIMQSPKMRHYFSEKNSRFSLTDEIYEKISSIDWWKENYKNSLTDISNKLNVSHTYVWLWAHRLGIEVFVPYVSKEEMKIRSILDNNNIPYISNIRNIIPPYELDIYIPSKNLAIEVNGIYWHSELNGKDRNYHRTKYEKCNDRGIQLLQFWDIEINEMFPIIESMILNKLGKTKTKIYARNCIIKKVPSLEAKEFFDQNHIQKATTSSINYGLYYQDVLVSCMSFIRSRYRKDIEYELGRYANKINCSVIGGFSRLLKFADVSCVSYSDNRYSAGNVYELNKFILESELKAGYSYITENGIENRVKYRKNKLSSLLKNFDSNLTEWENMKNNDYDRIWNSGIKTWIFNK